jgi:hypothetical protein
MATGDLDSWRQTSEIVQLVGDAHSALEKMRALLRPLVEDLQVRICLYMCVYVCVCIYTHMSISVYLCVHDCTCMQQM